MKIEVLTASTVDYDEVVRLQRECFEGVASPALLGTNQTVDYYRWKYTMAGGEARIAQIRDDQGNLVAMNSAFPVTLTHGDRTLRGWQSGDTATLPAARGQGCFIKCLTALKGAFGDGDVFFGFPNANSTHGFAKFGMRRISDLQLFAGIVLGMSPRPGIRRIERFGPEQDDLAARLAAPGTVMIQRSAAYMNDRYFSPLRPLYTSFVHPDGCIVVRTLKMYGLRIGLIMDCMATSPGQERQLFLHVGYWCRQQRAIFAVTLNNISNRWGLLTRGLVPIPHRLAPRPLVLMAQAVGNGDAPSCIEAKWSTYVGDWDVF